MRLLDLVAGLLVASWVLSIVQIPPIPISPIIYLPFVLLAVADGEMRRAWPRVVRTPAFGWIAALLVLKSLSLVAVGTLSYETFAEVGRVVAGILTLAGLAMYAASRPARLRRLAGILVLTCGISLLWYLAELAVGDPFVSVRNGLYADIYAAHDEGLVETIRSGLTPFRHQLGYQLSGFLPLVLLPLLRARVRRRELLLIVAGLAVGLAALVASLQRSALIAMIISATAIAWYSRRLGRMATVAVAAGTICVAVAGEAIRRSDTVALLAEATLFDKLQSQDSRYDSALRGELQARALELIWQHPLGLVVADLDWNDVGFQYVYDRMRAVSSEYEQGFAVHNGYLGDALNYGIGYLVVTLLAVGCVFGTAYQVLRRGRDDGRGDQGIALGVAGTVFGLYSIQAMTHNASIVTLEPVSLVVLSLLIACALPAPAPSLGP